MKCLALTVVLLLGPFQAPGPGCLDGAALYPIGSLVEFTRPIEGLSEAEARGWRVVAGVPVANRALYWQVLARCE